MNTVTITTDEYKALTEKAMLLDIMLDTTDYRATDVLNAYRDAVKSRAPKESAEEIATESKTVEVKEPF